jgi:hypothetical protein
MTTNENVNACVLLLNLMKSCWGCNKLEVFLGQPILMQMNVPFCLESGAFLGCNKS